MDRVALFGGGGFIGSNLTKRLLEDGYDLVVVDIDSEKIDDLLPHDRIEYYELDIREPENDAVCRRIVDSVDIVVDLVAYANPQQYVDIPLDVVDLNYDKNMKIVEDCVETDTRIVQFSTCEVYGKLGNRAGEEIIFSEDTSDVVFGPIGQQRWIYASAKELLERVVHAHAEEHGLEFTIIRPFNFVGPEMDYIITSEDEGTPRVFASFMSALLYDHTMYLVDGGTNRRAFTYIDDAVDAIELILENEDGQFTNEAVNIGTPRNDVSIREFARLMRDIYQEVSPNGKLPDMEEISGEEFYGDGYEDCEQRIPDISKLEAAGWEPEYDLREALEETVTYYVEKHEGKALVDASD
jgi:nucleoside-diphosphate-sugar epimerase